jgi:hypothetical protein
MDIKKKDIYEIIDGNSDVIGSDAIPKNGPNLDTQAKNTTDVNAKVGTQPYRYDMLGRFGFTLMPFLEEGEGNEELFNGADFLGHPLTKKIAEYLYIKNLEQLKRYYKNPKLMQREYREKLKGGYDVDESSQTQDRMAADILEIVKSYLGDSFNEFNKNDDNSVNESKVVEDKMVKKSETEITKKSESNDVKEKKIEKLAGLINKKLEKKDLDKLINLLERK